MPAFLQPALLLSAWASQAPSLQLSLQAAVGNPQPLYDVQEFTQTLIEGASIVGDLNLIDEIAGVFLSSADALQDVGRYVVYLGGSNQTFELSPPSPMWVDGVLSDGGTTGTESILCSAQFNFALARLSHIIAAGAPLPSSSSSSSSSSSTGGNSTALLALAEKATLDAYTRWVMPPDPSSMGVFQVHAWGCDSEAYRYTHAEFLQKKLDRALADRDDAPLYCNAVTDEDMWIVAGVTELLAAHGANPAVAFPSLSPEAEAALRAYVQLGAALIKDRLGETALVDFVGGAATGLLFDQGMWNDHPDWAYAGVSDGSVFPAAPPSPPLTSSWDVSHGRRLVFVSLALERNRDIVTNQSSDTANFSYAPGLCNQFLYANLVRQGAGSRGEDASEADSEPCPLFTNFMSGASTWYRVGYHGPAFGYGPTDLSSAGFLGGFGLWAPFCGSTEDMARLMGDTLWPTIASDDPAVVQCRLSHYGTNWDAGPDGVTPVHKNASDPAAFSIDDPLTLLQFLPAYLDWGTAGESTKRKREERQKQAKYEGK